MHPYKLFLEFGTHEFGFICRSCLSTLRKQALPVRARWPRPIRHSSSQSTQTQPKHTSPIDSTTVADQEAERRKVLEALGLLNNDDQPLTINYFEQGDFGRLRRLDDQDDFRTSLVDPGGVVDKRLKQLEQQLEQAHVLIEGLKDMAKEMKEKDEAHNHPLTPDLPEDQLKRVKSTLIPVEGWKHTHGAFIVRLNRVLDRATYQLLTGGVKARTMNRLWGYYSRIRRMLADRSDIIPGPTWDLLWKVFSVERRDNPNRMSRIHLLSKDMQLAGVPLTDAQRLLAIEAMFIDGWQAEALENHKRFTGTLGTRQDTFMDFWELGLRMYCLAGDIDRAQRVIHIIMKSPYRKEDHRVLFPFIRACASDPAAVEIGFEAYRRLRGLYSDSFTIQDYDEVTAMFLASNQTEYALYIFVDMMTSGCIDLRGKKRLPMTIANPFFFGKWLKRLIGAGHCKGAYNVLLLMEEKGIIARPIQVNALLGSWLRSQTADNIRQAEEVGWAMIRSRIRFVNDRRETSRLERSFRSTQTGGWPNATLETFKLLAENYKDRGVHKKMEELWVALEEAELPPDSFMVNQLLFSYLNDGQGSHVHDLFRDLSKKYKIQADPWTFMALWYSLPINTMWSMPFEIFPNERSRCRRLFADMVRSASTFAGKGFDADFAGKLLHTFRRVKDRVGLLAAVRALRHVFNFVPPEGVILALLVGTLNLEKGIQHPPVKDRLIRHLHRLEAYLEHRRRELVAVGELQEDDALPEATKREEVCNFFEIHLENECEDSSGYPEGWELELQKAVEDMGLHEVQDIAGPSTEAEIDGPSTEAEIDGPSK